LRLFGAFSRGVAPGWYEAAPSALGLPPPQRAGT